MSEPRIGPSAELYALIRRYWSFDDGQMHTHTWHDREDFLRDVLPKIIAQARRDALEEAAMLHEQVNVDNGRDPMAVAIEYRDKIRALAAKDGAE